jgi:hypothetical protein
MVKNLDQESKVLDQAESTIKQTYSKAVDLDKVHTHLLCIKAILCALQNYDLLEKTKSVLWKAGTISNEALKKVCDSELSVLQTERCIV